MERRASVDRERQEGNHRIFLGYAPGVGTATAMLTSAQRLYREGADVVIGCVETHQRLGVEALLRGLEVVSPSSASPTVPYPPAANHP